MTKKKLSDVVGINEIADRIGKPRNTVKVWRHRGILPEERWSVSGIPAWDWTLDIVPWLKETGRAA